MKKNITVFCGSAEGNQPIYMECAQHLGETLAAQGRTLIYGAGSRGLMGMVARSALQHDGHVIGVNLTRFSNPKYLMEVSENLMTSTIQERKMKMLELCDASIVLPGGVGTLDEMFEILSMLQLGLTDKPLGILNLNGYYDPLLKMIDQMRDEGFFNRKYDKIWIVRDCVEDLLTALDNATDVHLF